MAYITHAELTGKKEGTPALVRELSQLRLSEVLRCAAALLSRASRKEGGSSRDAQLTFAYELLPREMIQQTEKLFREDPDRGLFHHRQLRLLVQLAVQCCSEDTKEVPDLAKRFGRCCMLTSDLLSELEELASIRPPDGASDEDATMLVMPTIEPYYSLSLPARGILFWRELPKDPVVLKAMGGRAESLDLEADFERAATLPLHAFIEIVFAFIARFATHDDASAPLLQPADYSPSFSSQHVAATIKILSATPAELARLLLGRNRQSWTYDIGAMRERPLIEVFEGKCMCTDIALLFYASVDQVYYTLDRATFQFRSAFGHIFARYIELLIEQFTYSGNILHRTYYGSVFWEGTNDEVCDGIIDYGETVLVIETKGRLLSPHQRFGGDRSETMKGIESILLAEKGAAAGQLAAAFKGILAGRSMIARDAKPFTMDHRKTYLPVVILYEEYLGMHSVRNMIDKKMREYLARHGVPGQQIGPVLLFTVSEFEYLEAMAHSQSPESVFAAYATFLRKYPAAASGSFLAFAYGQLPLPTPGIGYLNAKHVELAETVKIAVEERQAAGL